MNSFGELASIASIAAVILFLGATANPASANLNVSDVDYAGKLGSVRIDIARTGNKLQIQVAMTLDCTRKKTRSVQVITTEVNPKSGKFRFVTPKDQRKVNVGAWFADITGHITDDGNVTGRVGMVKSDHFSGNYTCFSGKSIRDFWMPFGAWPVDPDRFSIYRSSSRELKVKFAVDGRKVYIDSLRDHRTCSGRRGGWGMYFDQAPVKVKRDGSFGFLTTDDFGQTLRVDLTAKIQGNTIRGRYIYTYRSVDQQTGDSTDCWTGRSYNNPKVGFTAKLVK